MIQSSRHPCIASAIALYIGRVGNSLFRTFTVRSLAQNCSLQKRNLSESLWSRFKNGWCKWFERIACKKQANRLQKSLKKVVFFTCFWLFSPFLCPKANGSHHFSQKSDIERFAQVTHDKRAIHSFSFTKNERIDQKTDERIPNPGKLQFFKILGNNYTVCYKTSLQNSMKLTTMFYSTTVCTV